MPDEELAPLLEHSEQTPPICEGAPKKKAKKIPNKVYLGLWIDGDSNDPVAYFSEDNSKLLEDFAKDTFGDRYVIAKVLLDSRPLVTRSNLRGIKNLILDTLSKHAPKAE